MKAVYEFWIFGLKQAYACIFAGLFLGFIILTHFYYPISFIYRYDFLFLAALTIQLSLLAAKLETFKEFYTIVLFHIIATIMEIFKTQVGSWHYPDQSYIKILSVPLFAGFMYSAVGSYIARIWRIFTLRFEPLPQKSVLLLISFLVYVNFFSHHYIFDLRWVLLAIIAFLLRRSFVYFTVAKEERRMHAVLGLFLVSLFIWFAENIATYCKVWYYPSQIDEWTMVSPNKLIAWFLLMFISFSLIACIHVDKMSVQRAHK